LFAGSRRLPVADRSPPKRLAKACASSGLAKQNTMKSLSSQRREYASGVVHRTSAAQKYHLTVLEAPHLFGRKRHLMWPFRLEITGGDFAFAVGHGIAIGLLSDT
jgi:hypothetical protein